MSQTSVNIDQSKAFAGLAMDIRTSVNESYRAEGNIEFGLAVVSGTDPEFQARTPKKDIGTVVYDIPFEASNSIAFSVSGVAITPVVYATSHQATMDALVAAVDALDGVTAAEGGTNQTIVVEEEGVDIVLVTTVTLGTNQAVGTITYASDDVFKGFARHAQHYTQDLSGDAKIEDEQMFTCMEFGGIWAPYTGSPVVDGVVYIVAGGANTGKVTDSSTGNLSTNWVVKSIDSVKSIVAVKNTK